MIVVRARTSDAWNAVPKQPIGKRVVEKTLVKALEHGVWAVDHEPVYVFPGLVVSFIEAAQARFFLDRPQRAERLVVDAGELVVFHEDADAMHFVKQGDAEPASEEEASAHIAAIKLAAFAARGKFWTTTRTIACDRRTARCTRLRAARALLADECPSGRKALAARRTPGGCDRATSWPAFLCGRPAQRPRQ